MGIPPMDSGLGENPIRMDDLEVPLFQETTKSALHSEFAGNLVQPGLGSDHQHPLCPVSDT